MLKQKLSNFGDIMHAENESVNKSIMPGMIEGRRGRGRLNMCRTDVVKATTPLSLPEQLVVLCKLCRIEMFVEI